MRGWVALCERERHAAASKVANLLCYEDLLAEASPDYAWPLFDENTASTLCYTSGTTGNPKGVLYSHRSTVLHAFAACAADALALSARDSILMVVPLFHANAWSLPFSGGDVRREAGAARPEARSRKHLHAARAGGVHQGVRHSDDLAQFPRLGRSQSRAKLDLSKLKLKQVVSGGTAPPRATIEKFHDLLGVFLLHAWGMTETSPLATTGSPLGQARRRRPDATSSTCRSSRAGRSSASNSSSSAATGATLPHDGISVGELKVRGNWVISGYFKGEGGQVVDEDGWFGTGDVATIDPDGYVQLTDRLKDVIKSGGEWISSIEIENLAVSHPDVFEAAVIAVAAPGLAGAPAADRPAARGRKPTKQSILDFLSDKLPKWWMPDDVVFVDALPHTATGKLLKTELRAALSRASGGERVGCWASPATRAALYSAAPPASQVRKAVCRFILPCAARELHKRSVVEGTPDPRARSQGSESGLIRLNQPCPSGWRRAFRRPSSRFYAGA